MKQIRKIIWVTIIFIGLGLYLVPQMRLHAETVDQGDTLRQKVLEDPENYTLKMEWVEYLVGQDRGEEAVEDARLILKNMPENPHANHLLAVALRQKMGNNPLAWMMGKGEYIDLLKEAMIIDPGFTDAYAELIGFYINAPAIAGGGESKAIKVIERLEKIDRKKGSLQRINLLSKNKKYGEVTHALEALHTAYPNDGEVLYKLGLYFVVQERYEEAVPVLEKGIKIEGPFRLNCLYQAGKARILAQSDLMQAVDYFDVYIEAWEPGRNPTKADAHWRKAEALKLMNQRDEARMSLEQALRLDPDHKQAKESLKKHGT